MTDIVSKPDYGATLVDKDGKASPGLQLYLDDLTILLNAVTTGTGVVNSVNGLVGTVVLTTTEISQGNNLYYPSADLTKLAGIATGATANSTDATLLARVNHTGTQLSSTISDFDEASQDAVGTQNWFMP